MIVNEYELRVLEDIRYFLKILSNPTALDDRVHLSMAISFGKELKEMIEDAKETSD